MSNLTFGIIKPDAVKNGKAGAIIQKIVKTILIPPIIIPANAIPRPPYCCGFASTLFFAIKPVIIAAIPVTAPQQVKLKIPQTSETIASVLS